MVRLYTKQHVNSLQELEKRGEVTNKELYVRLHMGLDADYFSDRYRTFVKLADRVLKKPAGVEYPIWCAISKDTTRMPFNKEVVYCLNVPEEEIIYFNAMEWDLVLNYLYVPLDDEDEARFRQEVKKLGVTDAYNFIHGKYAGFYPEIEAEIRNSWQRIFDVDPKQLNRFRHSGNLWHIKKEWVEHIIYPGDDFAKITAGEPDMFGL